VPGARRTAVYLDSEGNPTESPAAAVSGEIVETPEGEGPPRRTWFRFEEVELKWLPMSEAAFLLWVLALLVLAWLVVAVFLLVL
jgi:hypothetical protein